MRRTEFAPNFPVCSLLRAAGSGQDAFGGVDPDVGELDGLVVVVEDPDVGELGRGEVLLGAQRPAALFMNCLDFLQRL